MLYILCIPVKLTARYSMLERLNPYIEYPVYIDRLKVVKKGLADGKFRCAAMENLRSCLLLYHQYRYWSDEQPVFATLLELGASGRQWAGEQKGRYWNAIQRYS